MSDDKMTGCVGAVVLLVVVVGFGWVFHAVGFGALS